MFVGLFSISITSDATQRTHRIRFGHGVTRVRVGSSECLQTVQTVCRIDFARVKWRFGLLSSRNYCYYYVYCCFVNHYWPVQLWRLHVVFDVFRHCLTLGPPSNSADAFVTCCFFFFGFREGRRTTRVDSPTSNTPASP